MSEVLTFGGDLRDIKELAPYSRNSRTHSPEQVQQIVNSINEFGWTNAVLADNQGIIAGHGRVLAAELIYKSNGVIRLPNGSALPFGMVPVIDVSGWSDEQRRAYIIADNKLALNAGWDDELLRIELLELRDSDFDLSLTGFSEAELDDLLDVEIESEEDPDEVPEVPEEPYSKLGDTWICGAHRVRCGSSTSMDDWDALMQGELADMQVCDPPYNVAYESKLAGSIKNDDMADDQFYDFLFEFYSCSFAVLKSGAAMYVAHADSEGANFRKALKAAGFNLKACLMWVKNSLVLGRGDFHYRHEPILYATKSGASRAWFGGRKQTTVLEIGESSPFEKLPDGRFAITHGDSVLIVSGDAVVEQEPTTLLHFDKPRRSPMHPTMKPVALWERLMKNNARKNDIIIDGFGGSGTTMIAAERLGMCARLMELDPRFVDVIACRYAKLTGRMPVHADTGEQFPREVFDRLTAKWGEHG